MTSRVRPLRRIAEESRGFSRRGRAGARFPGKPDRSRVDRSMKAPTCRAADPSLGRVPGSSCYILITYLSERQDREEDVVAAEVDRSRRTARPFCLWERITHGEKEMLKESQVE